DATSISRQWPTVRTSDGLSLEAIFIALISATVKLAIQTCHVDRLRGQRQSKHFKLHSRIHDAQIGRLLLYWRPNSPRANRLPCQHIYPARTHNSFKVRK